MNGWRFRSCFHSRSGLYAAATRLQHLGQVKSSRFLDIGLPHISCHASASMLSRMMTYFTRVNWKGDAQAAVLVSSQGSALFSLAGPLGLSVLSQEFVPAIIREPDLTSFLLVDMDLGISPPPSGNSFCELVRVMDNWEWREEEKGCRSDFGVNSSNFGCLLWVERTVALWTSSTLQGPGDHQPHG